MNCKLSPAYNNDIPSCKGKGFIFWLCWKPAFTSEYTGYHEGMDINFAKKMSQNMRFAGSKLNERSL